MDPLPPLQAEKERCLAGESKVPGGKSKVPGGTMHVFSSLAWSLLQKPQMAETASPASLLNNLLKYCRRAGQVGWPGRAWGPGRASGPGQGGGWSWWGRGGQVWSCNAALQRSSDLAEPELYKNYPGHVPSY
jgi:hypothetical protein